jgi:hypothetical protein
LSPLPIDPISYVEGISLCLQARLRGVPADVGDLAFIAKLESHHPRMRQMPTAGQSAAI